MMYDIRARQILIGSPQPAAFSAIKASTKILSKIQRLDSMLLLSEETTSALFLLKGTCSWSFFD